MCFVLYGASIIDTNNATQFINSYVKYCADTLFRMIYLCHSCRGFGCTFMPNGVSEHTTPAIHSSATKSKFTHAHTAHTQHDSSCERMYHTTAIIHNHKFIWRLWREHVKHVQFSLNESDVFGFSNRSVSSELANASAKIKIVFIFGY